MLLDVRIKGQQKVQNKSITDNGDALGWQKRHQFHSQSFGQNLRQKRIAEIICFKSDSLMVLFAPSVAGESITTSKNVILASAGIAVARRL